MFVNKLTVEGKIITDMDVATIFKEISESRLLKNLKVQEKLLFVGEEKTIEYLQDFFERNNSCNYSYHVWQKEINISSYDFSKYRAIIISSVESEHTIYEEFTKNCAKNLTVPILKLFTDIFVNLQAGRQLLQPSSKIGMPPKIVYAIASTPRSGSTFLCELLSSTQIAGFPQEDLRQSSEVLTQSCQFDCVEYLQNLMLYKATSNGVFGTKLISHFLKQHIDYQPSLEQFIDDFVFVYLVRKDKIAQAVSTLLATKTKTWHLYSKQEDKKYQQKLSNIKIENSDFERIKAIHQRLSNEESFLERFFNQKNLSPLVIEYENLVEAPEENLNKILKYLKVLPKDREVRIVDKYRYKIYQIIDKLNIFGADKQIRIKLKTQKIKSDLSAHIVRQYQDRYL